MTTLWTHDAPCNACGLRARDHDEHGLAYGCTSYIPVACQGPDDNHGGPVRVREDDAELCWRHEEARTR